MALKIESKPVCQTHKGKLLFSKENLYKPTAAIGNAVFSSVYRCLAYYMKSPTTASNASRKKNNNQALILHSTQDAYFLIDPLLNIQFFNPAAFKGIKEKFGISIQAGMSILDTVPPERRAGLKALYQRVLAGAEERSESLLALPGQPDLYFENRFTPAYHDDGSIAGVTVCTSNISERKRAENKLKEAEERWRFALEAANQGAWDWDLVTDEVIYSSSYKKMYGFENDELKNHISEWELRVHPDDLQRMKAAIRDHVDSDDNYYESIYRLQLKNGDYKWIMARGKLIGKDEKGKPLRMIGTHTDLTASIETQNKLNAIAERFAYAAKATRQALWEWNAATGEVYMSPIFTELFGWEADGNNQFEQWHYYIHPDDQKQTVDSYYHTINKTVAENWEAEYRFLKKDGSYAVVIDKAYIIRDGDKAVKVIGATEDITHQKKVEKELYDSNERYNIMLKATHELLWEWHIKDDFIFRSREGLRNVYGVNDNTSIGTKEAWMERIHPDDREKLDGILKNFLKGDHQQTFEIEYHFRRDDGSYAYIYDRGILLKDDKGQAVRLIGSAQDMSERKRLENEILQNELDHKKLINQATVDSQEQERGEIGKELHDNVNQVLTTSKLYLELALANEDLAKDLIKKSSKNISAVINEIRQLSRSLMDPSLGDLGIVDSINDLIDNINLARKIKITLDIDKQTEALLDEKQKLTVFRIIQESLNNVIRHAKAKLVSVVITTCNDMVELIISDDGIGFVPEQIKRGAGLKNITNRVYLINGNFIINSRPGIGCQITIRFPVTNQLNIK